MAALLTAALTRQASCIVQCGNLVAVGTYCYVAVCTLQARSAWRREALRRPQRKERGGGILWRPPARLFYNKLCAWRHNMPPPLSSPWAPKRLAGAEQTQRNSTFPRRKRSRADRCSRLTR